MRYISSSCQASQRHLLAAIGAWPSWLVALILLTASARLLSAQNVPIISGGVGFLDSTNAGVNFFQPVVAPVVVAPLGKSFLFESRFDLREFYIQQNGGYQGRSWGQLSICSSTSLHLHILPSAEGAFLLRLALTMSVSPRSGFRTFKTLPLIYPIGTRTTGSSDGGMLRGVVFSKPTVQMNYIGYFSASSSVSQFESARTTGGQVDFYFPGKRVEIGTSYSRFLQSTNYNSVGAHFWWLPWSSPLQVRSEYAHAPGTQGYWIEAAYRLSQWGGADSIIGRLEPVFRMQQVFRNGPSPVNGLPAANTQQTDFGLDYNFPHNVRLNSSYSRKFSKTGDANIWDVSLTYRFLLPLWRGHE